MIFLKLLISIMTGEHVHSTDLVQHGRRSSITLKPWLVAQTLTRYPLTDSVDVAALTVVGGKCDAANPNHAPTVPDLV